MITTPTAADLRAAIARRRIPNLCSERPGRHPSHEPQRLLERARAALTPARRSDSRGSRSLRASGATVAVMDQDSRALEAAAGRALDDYLAAEEFAARLKCSPKSIYRLAQADPSLPVLRIGKLRSLPARAPRAVACCAGTRAGAAPRDREAPGAGVVTMPFGRSERGLMNPALALLLSPVYDGVLTAEHRADLDKSGLTEATIRAQFIRSVPPAMIDPLLGSTSRRSARPSCSHSDRPRAAHGPRVPEALPARARSARAQREVRSRGAARPRACISPRRIGTRCAGAMRRCGWWKVSSEKVSPSRNWGCPPWGSWGSKAGTPRARRTCAPTSSAMPLRHRIVELLPDGDWQTNPNVERGVRQLGHAPMARGARPRIVVLPTPAGAAPVTPKVGADDYLAIGPARSVTELPRVPLTSPTLDDVHEAFRKYLGSEYDLGALDAVLATAAAEQLPGDPC